MKKMQNQTSKNYYFFMHIFFKLNDFVLEGPSCTTLIAPIK